MACLKVWYGLLCSASLLSLCRPLLQTGAHLEDCKDSLQHMDTLNPYPKPSQGAPNMTGTTLRMRKVACST